MAMYTADIEAAKNFVPQNQYTAMLEQYRRKSKKPTLLDVEVNRPGPDIKGFYERLDLIRKADQSATEVALTQAQNMRAQQELANAQALGASLQYNLSGVTPQFLPGTSGRGYSSPLAGKLNLTSSYGYRKHPITGVTKLHTGNDFSAPTGTPIYATHAGRITTAGWDTAYGNVVTISGASGLRTLYGHQSRLAVQTGQYVQQGQLIGYVGTTGYSTGPHLHYEVRIGGRTVNPAGYY